jgi:hypothetical protein
LKTSMMANDTVTKTLQNHFRQKFSGFIDFWMMIVDWSSSQWIVHIVQPAGMSLVVICELQLPLSSSKMMSSEQLPWWRDCQMWGDSVQCALTSFLEYAPPSPDENSNFQTH